MLLDKTKFTRVRYVQGKKEVRRAVNDVLFKSMKRLGECNVHEISMGNHQISLNLPIQIGITILLEAKLHMLRWYYCFVSVFIPRSLRATVLTDTDSLYFALGADSLDKCVSEHKRWEYNHRLYDFCFDNVRHPDAFLQRRCCKKHFDDDGKEPGLFKSECRCTQVIALCSKTYICELCTEGVKLSAKGVNNQIVLKNNPLKKFKGVLDSKVSAGSRNVGFVEKDGQIFTYATERLAFPWLYLKREVQAGGAFTKTIDVVLKPCPRKFLSLQEDLCVLAPDFDLTFVHPMHASNAHTFRTIRQALCLIKREITLEENCKSNAVSKHAEKYNIPSHASEDTILCCTNPKALHTYMQRMGDCEVFDQAKYAILARIVESRLVQYPEMLTLLKHTKGHHIVNACEHDSSCGNGSSYRVTRWKKDAYLEGENLLGEIYMHKRTQSLTVNSH